MTTKKILFGSTLLAAASLTFLATPANAAADLTWAGSNSSDWDTSTDNWKYNGNTRTWANGNNAIFDATADNRSVTISNEITAADITVTGASYTFTIGSGYSLSASNLTIDSGASLKITGDGKTTFSSNVYLGYSPNSSGSMEITGGETTFNGLFVYVGYYGTGKLTITGGTTTFASEVELGYYGTSTGELTIGSVDGTGGTTFEKDVRVGNWGTGLLTISGGKTTFSSSVYLGYYSGSSGTLTITGGETTFGSTVYVGEYGTGTLTIGSVGGTGGETTFNGTVYVGSSGKGTLTIYGGTTTFGSTVNVGNGSTGSLSISGGETTFEGAVNVGNGSTGSLSISGGETTFSSSVNVATGSSLSLTGGTITLSGAISNSGTVTASNNVVFVLDNLTASSDGTYTIISGDGTINDWSTLTGSNFSISGAGHLVVNVSSAGQVTITATGVVADLVWNGTENSNVWTNDGERIWLNNNVADVSYTDDNVTFNDDAAEKNVTISGEVIAGSVTVTGDGADYTFSFASDSSLTATTLTIDSGASLVIEGSGEFTTGSFSASTTIDGLLTIDNTKTTFDKDVHLGSQKDSSGKINITGGTTIFSGNVYIGFYINSSGNSLTISDGETTFEGEVSLGYYSGSSGTIEISGGTTKFNKTVYVGYFGKGELTISGGETNFEKAVYVGYNSGKCELTITGGETTFKSSVTVAAESSLLLSGGTITLYNAISNSGTVTIDTSVENSVVFVLDDLETGENTYTIISGDGDIEGWELLTASNFLLDGKGLRRSTIDVETDGQVTITYVEAADLVWNGTGTDNVWTNNGDKIWLNDTDSDYFYSCDNVTFGSAGEKSVTISGEIEAGTITVTGNGYTFSFNDGNSSLTADSLTINSGASLVITGTGSFTVSPTEDYSQINGELTLSGSVTTEFNEYVYVGYTTTPGGGVEGTLTIGSVDGPDSTTTTFNDVVYVGYSYGTGTVKITGGTTTFEGEVYLGYSTNSTGTMEISGGETKFESNVYVGHNGNGSLTISDGETTFSSGYVLIGRSSSKPYTGILTITGGSTTFNNSAVYVGGGSNGTGKLMISGGTTEFNTKVYVGADTSTGTIEISGNATTTFNGAVYVGYNSGTGELTISGGETTFSSSVTVSADSSITVSGGSLKITKGLTSTGTITVSSGTLSLDGTIDLSSAISNSGTVTLGDSVVFVLNDALAEEGDGSTTYTLIDGGTTTGWKVLDYSNFVDSEGNELSHGHTTLDVSVEGSVTITTVAADLVWNGDESTSTWTTDTSDKDWKASDGSADYFANGDSVTFDGTAASKSVTISGTIKAGSVKVTGNGYTFTFSEDSSVTANTLTIAEGASLEITGEGSFTTGSSLSTIGGSLTIGSVDGTDSVTATFGGDVYVGNSGTGTIEITGGTTKFLSSMYLGSIDGYTGTMGISGGEATFGGIVYVGYYGRGTMEIGSVEGTGGKTTFEGEVRVGYYGTGKLTIISGETSFGGAVTVGYSGTGELTISGGDVTFSSSVIVSNGSSLSLTGGTITLSKAISNSGTVTLSDSVTFVLNAGLIDDSYTGGGVLYTFISGGTIEVWDSLTYKNFTIDGKEITSARQISFNAAEGSVIYYEDAVPADLVWNGSSTGDIWSDGTEDDLPQDWTNGDRGRADAFYNGDSVTFDATAAIKSVTISGKVIAGSVTVTGEGYEFSFDDSKDSSLTADTLTVTDSASAEITNGTTTIEGTVTVDEGGSLTISGGSTKVTGSATVSANSTLSVSGGSLEISGGLTSTGSITVGENANLSLDGTIDLSSAITNTGTVTLSDSVTFVLNDSLKDDNYDGGGVLYTFIDGGSIEGWDSLTYKDFTIDGSTVSSARQINFNTDDGSIIYNADGAPADLVWNGKEGELWSDGTGSDSPKDWKNGSRADAFYAGDNVTFNGDAAAIQSVTKSVTISGEIEAGSVTVTGEDADYTFSFDADSSLTADSLTIDLGASLEIKDGTTTIEGAVTVHDGSSLAISGGTTTADSIFIGADSSIELTGGELTVNTIELFGDSSSGSFSGGNLNVGEIISDGSVTFGEGLTVGVYVGDVAKTAAGVADLTIESAVTLDGAVTFNAKEDETIAITGTIDGEGSLTKTGAGTLTVSGENNTYTGDTTISAGTLIAEQISALGTGAVAIDDGATLELAASGTFTNATSGSGTMRIANNANVRFGSDVGVQTLEVASGATLSGGATLTSSGATLDLAGTLALDASAGEQVSFTNGGTVILGESAKLELSNTSGLDAGSAFTIVDGGTIDGDVANFLATDDALSTLATTYAVAYDISNGLSVTIVKTADASVIQGLRLHDGLGSDFIAAILDGEDSLKVTPGIKSVDEIPNSAPDPIAKAILNGDTSGAQRMLDTLAPDDYAAMVAMPTTSFHNDVNAIDNHLAAVRKTKFDENNRWGYFAQVQGTFVDNDDARDTQTFDFDLRGIIAGLDYRASKTLVVGATLGYDRGKAEIHHSDGKIESDYLRLTAYAGAQLSDLIYANIGAQLGVGYYDAKRKTALGPADGDTSGFNAGVFADVGMDLPISEKLGLSARPYVGVSFVHSIVSGFNDDLFEIGSFSGESLRTRIGCGFFWDVALGEMPSSIGFDVSYAHDFCGKEVDIDATYKATERSFGVTAKTMTENFFTFGPVFSVGLTKDLSAFAGYAFQAGTDSSIGHNVYIGVRATF